MKLKRATTTVQINSKNIAEHAQSETTPGHAEVLLVVVGCGAPTCLIALSSRHVVGSQLKGGVR